MLPFHFKGVYTPVIFGAMYLSGKFDKKNHFNQSHYLIVATPHSRNCIALSAITALYIISIFGTLWSALSELGTVKYNLQALVVSGGTSTRVKLQLTPDTSDGDIFLPTVEQVMSLIIADGLLVSLHCSYGK